MQPFRFRTAAQASADATTADEALAHALSPERDPVTRLRLYVGIAGRADVARRHVEKMLDGLPDRSGRILTTLWSNPVVSADESLSEMVLTHMSLDDIYSFAFTPNAEALLPRMLAMCNPYMKDQSHLEVLKSAFTPEQIEAAFHVLIDEFEQDLYAPAGRRSSASNLLLSTVLNRSHLTRLVDVIEQAVADAAMPLGSGRARRRTADYEDRINRMASAQDTIGTLLARKDLTGADRLSLVKAAEKVVADAAAFTPARHRDWARASATTRMLRNAVLTPQAMAHAFRSDLLHISLKDINLTAAGLDAALIATAQHPNPVLVQQALGSHFSLREESVEALLSQVRLLEAQSAMSTGPAKGDDDVTAWVSDGEAWWGAAGERSDKSERDIIAGLIRTSMRHVGQPVWDAVYDYVLTHPRYAGVPHGQVVDHIAGVYASASINWMDDSTTPTLHAFAAWASASDDEHLRRHAVAQCWEHAQLLAAAQDPSPLVRIEVLKHDLATTDDVLTAARDTDAEVRLSAAEHPHIDSRVISVLSNDPDERVRTAIARRVLDSLQA